MTTNETINTINTDDLFASLEIAAQPEEIVADEPQVETASVETRIDELEALETALSDMGIVADEPTATEVAPAPVVEVPAEVLAEIDASRAELSAKSETVADDSLKAQAEAEMVELEAKVAVAGYITQIKVKEKINHHFKVLRGGASMNKVVEIALRTLKTDGYLTGGRKGNLYQALLKKPYSDGTANAQMGQIMDMFPKLGMTTKVKSKLEPIADSAVLQYSMSLVK